MSNKIKGLFVAVELDQTALTKGVKAAVNTLKTEFEGVKQAVDSSLKLDSNEISNKLSSVAKSLNRIQNAINTKVGGEAFADAVKESDSLKESLEEVAKQAGISSEVLRDTFSKAIKANQVKATVGEVRSLARTLGISSDGIQQFAKDLGITGEALDKLAVKHEKATSRIAEVSMELKKLTGTDVTPSESEVANAVAVENSQKIVRNFKEYVRLMELSNGQALELAQKLGLSESTLEKITATYKESVSVADKELERLFDKISKLTGKDVAPGAADLDKAVQVDKAKQLVDLMAQYKTALGLSNAEVVEHAKKLGISEEALRRLSQEYANLGERAKSELDGIAKELKELTGKNVLSDKGTEFADAAEIARANRKVELVKRYAQMLNLSSKEAQELARNLGFAEDQIEQLTKHAQRLETSSGGLLSGLKNLMTGGNMMSAIQASLATLGANISMAGTVELGKAMVDTSIKVDSLRTAFTSIYKDANKAAEQLSYIRTVTDELGLEFYATAEAAKGFFAAAETSKIKNNASEIFRAFSAASSALKMSQEQTNGVFLAISQMMSKGKISAEEMRQQLAERLPGAVQLLATSMGKSLPELDKMFEAGEVGIENLIGLAKEVERVYGESGRIASTALLGEMNKLKSSWTDFKAEFINTEAITEWIRDVQKWVQALKVNIEDLRKGLEILGKALFVGGFVNLSATIGRTIKNIVLLRKEILATGGALTAFGATSKAVITMLGGWGTAISVISSAVYALTLFTKEVDNAKYSVDDFKKIAEGVSNATGKVEDSTKGTSKAVRQAAANIAKINLEKARKEFDRVADSIPNAGRAIQELYLVAEEAQKRVNTVAEYALGEEFVSQFKIDFEDTGLARFAQYAKETLDYLHQEMKAGRMTSEYAKKTIEELQAGATSFGSAGIELNEILKTQLKEIVDAYREVGLAQAYAEEKAKEAAEGVARISFDKSIIAQPLVSPKLSLENYKKQAQNSGNFELKATLDVLTSGDIYEGAEKAKISAEELVKTLKYAEANKKNAVDLLKKEYYISSELSKEIEKRAKLEQDKANAPILEKYKAFDNELKSVTAQLEDMAKASEHGPESVAYGLYKIEARAEKARKEVAGLGSKFKDIDPSKLQELKDLKLDLINKEEAAAIEAYFQKYKDAGKEAYHQLKELNGETNSAELESTLAKYDKILVGLTKWKDKEHELHKGNTEKLKQVDAEYVQYVEAIAAQKAEAMLRHSTKWEDGVKLGWKQYEKTATVTAGKVSDVALKAFQGMGDALANFVTSADMSWKSMGEAFSNLARSMINDITNIIAHATVMNGMKAMFGGTAFGSFLGMANGGVVNSGLSSFSNGVYNTPTFFNTNGGGIQRYANGGVFGEAGPEAIMPLTRMPNGRLGVAATGGGGGGGDVQVNVYNNSNSNAEVRQSTGSGGGKTIDVIIGDVVAKQMSTPGSKLNRTVTTYTGGQQAVTRR